MLIGITGKKRAGKDTAAAALGGFILYRFADPIKRLCKDIFLWTDDHVDGDLKEDIDFRWGISPRTAMQLIGTELFREYLTVLNETFDQVTSDTIWVKRFSLWYKKGVNVIIPDVRFLNEAKAIKDLGGIIIRIDREECEDIDVHSSEKEMDKIEPDIVIGNNGTVKQLQDHIRMLYGGEK